MSYLPVNAIYQKCFLKTLEILQRNKVVFPHHVIIDPPYELNMDQLYSDLREVFSGTIIIFSYLPDKPKGADEYHVWEKQDSSKNPKSRCINTLESFAVFYAKEKVFNSDCVNKMSLTNFHDNRIIGIKKTSIPKATDLA